MVSHSQKKQTVDLNEGAMQAVQRQIDSGNFQDAETYVQSLINRDAKRGRDEPADGLITSESEGSFRVSDLIDEGLNELEKPKPKRKARGSN